MTRAKELADDKHPADTKPQIQFPKKQQKQKKKKIRK